MIPPFQPDGYLPPGRHPANEAEIIFRFGTGSPHRRRLILRLRRWIQLARQLGARRLLLDGSFVTNKDTPGDIDAVILLPQDFQQRVNEGDELALELESMLVTRHPEEIFAAEDLQDWEDWFNFFSRTREADQRRKGLVEVTL
jgi:hypothetical protein